MAGDDEGAAPLRSLGSERFALIRRLGAGGMGVVYEALDREREVRVALKLLARTSPSALLRFKSEFRTLCELRHENLVRLYELIEERGSWFFTMELIDGVSLGAYIRHAGGKDPTQGVTLEVGARRAPPSRRGGTPSSAFEVADDDDPTGPSTWRPHAWKMATSSDPGYDDRRLRDSFAQLGAALAAIHRAGKLHRDLKPSNVMVDRGGRVVVLDFGIAIDLEPTDPLDRTRHDLIGTPIYMAPEQARGVALSPAADWYAVGVILHSFLTGRAPFVGSAADVLRRKRVLEPTPVRELAPWVPLDLATLCDELLALDPAARPAASEFLARLDRRALDRSSRAPAPEPDAGGFLGRDDELAVLQRELARVRAGEAAVVAVIGESGIGKTALARRFGELVRAADPTVALLASRCYELEFVPYKAMDRAIDQLSRILARADTEPEAIHAAAGLARTFPVLRNVKAVARAAQILVAAADPQEQRDRAFASLRALVGWLAARRTVILVVDDMQWADSDSQAMLADLLRPPAPPILLLALCRTEAGTALPSSVRALGVPVAELGLGRLPDRVAVDLAEELMTSAGLTGAGLAVALADESEGHPLFLDALVRHACRDGMRWRPIRLTEALTQRVEALDPDARLVLDLLAVAGQPLTREALGEVVPGFDAAAEHLKDARMLRTSGLRSKDQVEPFHDRLRETVLERMSQVDRRDRSSRLAHALERLEPDGNETLARLWLAAGDRVAARRHALAAGDRASAALAFEQAVSSYQLTLELSVAAADRHVALRRLGEALGNLGHGPRAAEALLAAVDLAPDDAHAIDLTRRAAEHLLQNGQVDRGLDLLERVSRSIGAIWPDAAAQALPRLVAGRIDLYLGQVWRSRGAGPGRTATDLRDLDTAWAVTSGLTAVDPRRSAVFLRHTLALAFESRDRARIGRVLGFEAGFLAGGSHLLARPAAALLAHARRVAQACDDRDGLAINTGLAGVMAFFVGDWRRCVALCDEAEREFRDHHAGVMWELGNVLYFGLLARLFLGDLTELARRVPLRRREAEERGNLFREVTLKTGLVGLLELVEDRPAALLVQVDDVMARWSNRGFHLQHYQAGYARARVALYRGDPDEAHREVEAMWPSMQASGLLMLGVLRLTAVELRAQAAVAAARHDPAALAEARRATRSIRIAGAPWSRPIADLIDAGRARTVGDADGAVALVRRALAGFEQRRMALYAAIARRTLGRLLGGDEGQGLVATAEQWMMRQGVKDPPALAGCFATGFD